MSDQVGNQNVGVLMTRLISSFSGASVFVIVLHAALYIPDEEAEPFDLEMEPV